MSEADHDVVAELLAVYALDAVDLDERRLVDEHLATCPKCRAELREHMAVASALGDTGAPAPPGVWDSIAGRLTADDGGDERASESDLPALDLAAVRREREADARSTRSRRLERLVSVAAAVVLIAVVATMGWVISDQQARLDEMESAMQGDSMMLDPDSSIVQLADTTGAPYATAVMGTNGRAVLIGTNLEPLPDGRSYQLWAVGPDGPVSLGVLGSDPHLVPFGMADDGSTVLAITDEPAGGSPAPTSDPMATGEMSDV